MGRAVVVRHIRSFDPAELPVLVDTLERLERAVNANPYIEYEDVTITTPATANADFAVNLASMNRTPTGYQVIAKNKACDVYTAPLTSTTRWGVKRLWLRCSGASATVTLRIT